ncbi:MAG: hypothetical protein OXK79_02990, partial [Chloroflexota bacterium]|nr:hypothetical protein [Chloroflexota bacterium]
MQNYQVRNWQVAALLVGVFLLVLAGCGREDEAEGVTAVPPTATAVPPTATVVPPTATVVPPTATAVPAMRDEDEEDEATVQQLLSNAELFEYEIGKAGGALTFATISDPLTFNLAIANDASSGGVLGYLFEGLTEVSWLTDEVEPALAESWTHSD